MEKGHTVFYDIVLAIILILSISAIAPSVSAADLGTSDSYNCRMYGVVSNNIPDGLIQKNLVNDQYSLKNMARLDSGNELNYNINGWGIAAYTNNVPTIYRGEVRAYNDPLYSSTISDLNTNKPNILLAHVRRCTSGCCTPIETVENPHPFTRVKNGKSWTFMHNGGVTPKSSMVNLIGTSYLNANAPFGSGVSECTTSVIDSTIDQSSNKIVDSELYFLYVMQKIEENNWDAVSGISAAIKGMVAHGDADGSINFLMSDGETLYGFKKDNELFYRYDAVQGYSAVASQPPNSSESWTALSDWQLIMLKPNQAPVIINDVRAYSPPSQAAPAISNPSPANAAVDVALNPALQADVKDAQNESVDWTVQLWDGANWQTIGSGTEADGSIRVNVPTTTITNYDTAYTWKVTARDPLGSDNTTEVAYSFTTKKASYAPTITNPVPVSGATAVKLNSTLSAYVEDKDGNLMNVTFSINDGSGWQTMRTYTNVATGTFTADGRGYIARPVTNYQWRVRVVDSTGLATEQMLGFKTGGLITLKWTANFSNTNYGQIMPVMGDIDNDGTQEIVFASGGRVYSVNGKTGATEWSLSDSYNSAPELADLNNDGIPEVLYGLGGPRVRAVNGDGSIRWTTPNLKGEGQPIFSLVAYDIDADGYPTIYFISEDTTPEVYNGTMNDYTGAITMLDHNGNVLADTWIYHPCWGGLSIGDTNFDGEFELYASDRRDNYTEGVHSKGIQAFNARTLEPLWQRPDIQHSSPMAILADVNNDGTQEVIAEKITLAGPIILNASTGATIKDYSNKNLPTHGTGTVYDIDDDGNLEIIMGTSYPDAAPTNFVVFDLVTGTTDFTQSFNYHTTWPPKLGDVDGDGKMEILAAMGNQENRSDFPLLIYDGHYNLIDQINITGAGQLTPARVYDVDGDGYNEIVVAGFRGKLLVYDTSAPTPNPAPRAGVQMYSESRLGAAEYVSPPGPKAPVIKDEAPVDGYEDSPLNPVLSLLAYDFQKDLMNITFEINDGSGWKLVKSYGGQGRGTFIADTTGFVTEHGQDYQWRAIADDGKGNINQKIFSFTTATESAWQMSGWAYRRAITIDHTKVAGELASFPVLIDFTDSNVGAHAQVDADDLLFTAQDGITKLNHEIEAYVSSDGHLIAWVNIPNLSSTQDTILYMYYGNPLAANQQNPEAVWDSNYLAVQHLEETSGTTYDSTAKNNDGSPLNGVIQNTAGKIDGADQFDGVNDKTQLPQVFTTQTQFTIEGWINTANKQGYAISQRDGASHGPFVQYYPTEGNFQFYLNNKYVKASATTGSWHYIVGTFDGSNAALYVDAGTPATATGATMSWPALPTLLGDRSSAGRAFQGKLDEIRFSDIARSESYVKTSFNNQNNPGAFMIVGSEEMASSKPIVSNVLPENEALDVPLNITALQFNLSDNGGDLMNYTVITVPDIGSQSGLNVAGGAFSVPVSGLQYETAYTWTVNVTDGKDRVFKTYTFTTIDKGSLLKDSAFDASVDGADLIANAAVQDWYESRAQNSALLTLDTNNISGNAGNKARLSGTTATDQNVYLTQEFKEVQTGNFSVSWDIFVESIANAVPYRTAMSLIGDDSTAGSGPNAANGERFVYLGFSSYNKAAGKMDLVARDRDDGFDAGQMTVVATDLDMDKWHNIRVDLNLGADTYDVYVDGVFKMTLTSRVVKTSVTHISFAQWNDGAGTFYVDNVHSPAAPFVECTENSQCSDNVFCNGEEQCIANSCVAGIAPVVDDGLFCTADNCDEANDTVLHLPVLVDDNVSCTVDSCDDTADMIMHAPDNAVCDNSLACDGIETCDMVLGCQAGAAVDCSANNLLAIATCNNNPDNVAVTFDTRTAFTSACEEPFGTCSIGDPGVASTCDFSQCGAQCDDSHACAPTDCDYKDGCVDKDYYDYPDAANSCGTDCACSNNTCEDPVITINDSRCGCQSDSDCDLLDQDYCDGNTVKHDEGKCDPAHVCVVETAISQTCDDDVYCNGKETCNLGICQPAAAIDCSASSLPAVATCDNIPDSIHFTWDAAEAFISTCDEDADACTSGSQAVTSTCSKASCGAECEINTDCSDTDCDALDGCVGVDYYEYSDVANSCTAGCACTDNVCGAATIIPNDARCKTALINDSAFDGSTTENIRTNDAGQDWYESRQDLANSGPTYMIVDETDVNGNSGKKAKLTGSLSANTYLTQEFSSAQSGTFSVQWDIYVDAILNRASQEDRGAFMTVGDENLSATNGPCSTGAERFVYMAFVKDGGATTGNVSLVSKNAAGTSTVIGTISLDQWHAFRVDIDVLTDKYTVYVDGTLVAANISAATPKANLTHISFSTWNDGAATFYVDNVQEYVPLTCVDNDGDGYGENCAMGADCDDSNNLIHPGAADAACDGVDNDCDLSADEDYAITATSCGQGACARAGQLTCSAGVETDSCTEGTPAADDADCNNVDDDCNGQIDEDYVNSSTSCGLGVCASSGALYCDAGTQIDSCVAGLPTGADDNCNNIDENCDGTADNAYALSSTVCGVGACASTGQKTCASGTELDSCTPGTPTDEVCDGADNDCDGSTDEEVTITFFADADGDTFGNVAVSIQACLAPAGYVVDSTDCNDANAAIHPGATEICGNGIDEDCSGADEVCAPVCGDGVTEGTEQCDSGLCCDSSCNFKAALTECRASAGLCDVAETCSGISADCPIDAFASPATVCREAASLCDAEETCSGSAPDCSVDAYMPPGTVLDEAFCSGDVSNHADTCDGSGNILEGVTEECAPYTCDSGTGLCNEMPCDANSDCQSGSACSESGNCLSDTDGDGVADVDDNCVNIANSGQEDCNGNDVGDACDAVNPGATEICDTIDNNCNDEVDEGGVCSSDCGGTDLNADGKVDVQDLIILTANIDRTDCTSENSYCSSADINKDGNVDGVDFNILTTNFGKTGCETNCGGADFNSDGKVDSLDLNVLNNNFGHANCALENSFCGGADINMDGSVSGADLKLFTPNYGKTNCAAAPVCVPSEEICDDTDNDCDLLIDEGDVCKICQNSTYYLDSDSDGFGDPLNAVQACEQPAGYADNNMDCGDADPTIHPGAAEACDGIDNDCDAGTSDGSLESWLGQACDGVDSDMCSEGTYSCNAGAQQCSDFSSDNAEICDGVIDDDCDGTVDEGCGCVNGATRPCGSDVGECVAGTQSCIAGSWSAECIGEVIPAAEACDDADNDCDGSTDEDIASIPTTCGLGACSAAGQIQCVDGGMADTCAPGIPAADDASCNNADDDCDGLTDEEYASTSTSCGLGVCAADGQLTCSAGVEIDSCIAGDPTGLDDDCNGVDENCDGTADNAYLPAVTSCGTGACASSGMTSCVGGLVGDSCTPGLPTDEICGNGVDENCDGTDDVCVFLLSVIKEGTGSGTITSDPVGIDCGTACSASYEIDAIVSLSATPDATSTFIGWTGGACMGMGGCSVRLDQARSVTASFMLKDTDNDGDPDTTDCAPLDDSINHAAAETCGNLVDENCDGTVPSCLLTDITFDASADSADLRTNGAGQDWYESRQNGTGGPLLLALDENVVGGRSGKRAKITGSPSLNTYLSQEFIASQTGTFTLQWDVYVDEVIDLPGTANPDRTGWMMVGDDGDAILGPCSTNTDRFVILAFAKNGGGTSGTMDLVARDNNDGWTAFTTIAAGLNVRQWYTIKIELNLNTDTYDVYVDGVKRATGVTARVAKTSLTHVSFASWNDGAGTFYVDNVYGPVSS